jgi:hypothetical protein
MKLDHVDSLTEHLLLSGLVNSDMFHFIRFELLPFPLCCCLKSRLLMCLWLIYRCIMY